MDLALKNPGQGFKWQAVHNNGSIFDIHETQANGTQNHLFTATNGPSANRTLIYNLTYGGVTGNRTYLLDPPMQKAAWEAVRGALSKSAVAPSSNATAYLAQGWTDKQTTVSTPLALKAG